MIPPAIEEDFLKVNYILGLKFLDGNVEKIFTCKILDREKLPILEYDFGSIDPGKGSGWIELKSGTYSILTPENEKTILQVYYGIFPSVARIYFRVPSDTDRWSVVGVRSVGDLHGCVRGRDSPYNEPSVFTRYFAIKDVTPNFNAYNPASKAINIKMRFLGIKYFVQWVDANSLTSEELRFMRVENIGGIPPVSKPSWLKTKGITEDERIKLMKGTKGGKKERVM